jgi:hypothetical protein
MATSSDQMLTCTNSDQLSDQSWRIIVPVVHVHALRYEQKANNNHKRGERENKRSPLYPPVAASRLAGRHRGRAQVIV